MDAILNIQLFNSGVHCLCCKLLTRRFVFKLKKENITTPGVPGQIQGLSSSIHQRLPPVASGCRSKMKVCAMRRRRRANERTGTYVLLEPGEEERFVSEEELKSALKDWLENWPSKILLPDLASYDTIGEAVSFLVRSVCELQIDGDVGSVHSLVRSPLRVTKPYPTK